MLESFLQSASFGKLVRINGTWYVVIKLLPKNYAIAAKREEPAPAALYVVDLDNADKGE